MRITIDVPELIVSERCTGPTWEAVELMLGSMIEGPGDRETLRDRAYLVRISPESGEIILRVEGRDRSILHNGRPSTDYAGTVTFERFGPASDKRR